ncbi:enoyl-CoA hydratase-related protein [Parvularcula maris]|uniref:Enoyl-CoA hydratase-related protein n=1 Tax=Parvularcula maris TaxID=2965077 RepID=A0A9X2RJI4_9PROT|nr:enoyl-CoA hydratase-related protein [Parvularcula maris]MCQ8184773.1 enoyl-CoA hydratase-related protein [Parvularcula maris]
MTDALRLTRNGPVATLTLSNPQKRNAMGAAFWEDLPDTVEELSGSGECRALVIDAEGPVFSSGIDLGMFQNVRKDGLGAAAGLDAYALILRMQRAFTAIEKARMPVIAAIQGGCIGGGVDLATACCIRLASEDAYFSVYEINIGMTADVGTFPRLLNHLPEGVVRELSYTGRKMGAVEAQQRGLVNRIYLDAEAVRAAAQEMAEEIASKAPMAVYGTKDIITYARDHATDEALDRIALWNASNLQPSELMAAMAAKQTGEPGQFASLPPKRRVDGK